ncbi:DUF421 domain-containing protein [Verrucomicrobiota bacterium]|nr:DUF421 domain-containing protein [Verrucomicrobiota bacterium]
MLAQATTPGLGDRLFQLAPLTPWWELMLRGIVVYVFLMILIRLTGRRQVGMLAPFDFILLLILSNAVQNSMNAGDNTLGGGLILATTLILLNSLMSSLSRRSKWIEGLLVGRPVFLIRETIVQEEALRKEKVTHHELSAALRAAGCPNIEAARHAILETNGSITVVHKEPA